MFVQVIYKHCDIKNTQSALWLDIHWKSSVTHTHHKLEVVPHETDTKWNMKSYLDTIQSSYKDV